MDSEIDINNQDIVGSSEEEPLRSVHDLHILVHPSFLVENTDHPLKYKGIREKPFYEAATKQMQEKARERFIPQGPDDLLLVMPHETPSLQSWRDSRNAKVHDPELDNWTDSYKAAKETSPHPNNVMIIGDLTWALNENWPIRVQEAMEDTQHELIDMLKAKGWEISGNTDITVGGEFRDLCVYEVARKILLLPFVQRLKIDKVTSFNQSYAYPFDEEGIADSNERAQDILLACLDDFNVGEDEEFIYVEKLDQSAASA